MKYISMILGVVCLSWLAGCGKLEVKVESTEPATNAPAQPAAEAAAAPKADEKACFACKGEGTVKCQACVAGQMDCPGNCLRLNRGVWVHMDVSGHPPTDVWQRFDLGGGRYTSYNQNHVGHVIAIQGGQAVDVGVCPVCDGTTKIKCKYCQGTTKVPCPICEGKKFVPLDWSPTNNAWLNKQPDLIRLTDGRIIFGKVVGTAGDSITIKTRDGKFMHLKASDITPPPDGATNKTVNP